MLARHLAGPDNVTIVQFHPAYSYEDFFEGFRPTPRSDGQVGFELKPGPMRRLTDRARTHPDQLFVLVVDEINRGNLAKIFGELYFLLEYRDEAIDLMYSSGDAEPFTLPCDVVIVGRDRALRTVRLPSWTRRCGGASDSFRCTRRRSPRNLLLRRWALRPQVPAACRGSASCVERCDRRSGRTCSDPRISCVRRFTVMGDWRRCFGSAIIPLLEEVSLR